MSHHVCAFLMLGDPTPELSFRLGLTAVEAGATMLELGFPFSDPCADGPAIQRSCVRARQAGVSTPQAFEILARIRAAAPRLPLNLLVYGNLVHARGYRRFCQQAAEAGASTLLVPDIPLEESPPLRDACDEAGLSHVQLVAPLTPPARLRALDDITTGFLYLAGYQGVTGQVSQTEDRYGELVLNTVSQVTHPVCLGFGVSKPEHIRSAFENGAHMVVVGSHLARAIERGLEQDRVLEQFSDALIPLTQVSSEGEIPCS